jgi:hypothetical protein
LEAGTVPPEYVLDCQNAIVPLGAGRNDNGGFHASGSAVLISRQIALTAKHVLVDYHQKAEYGEPLSGGQHVEVHFSIELGSGFGGGTWRDSVDWCATADGHDIALLRLRGTSGDFPAYPEIDVVPPRIGEPAAGATAPLAGAAGGAVSPVVLSPVGCPRRRYRSREKRALDSIAASFARRETRLPAFDFERFIGVLPACRIAVRRVEEEI